VSTLDETSFAVATYNVHGCVGRDRRRDPQRIADVLRELDADLVGLQEIHSTDDPDAAFGHLARVAALAGFDAVPGPALVHHTGGFGNALLTRHPVDAVRRVEIAVARREPRAVLDVEVRVGVRPVRVVVTHFGLLGRERRLQADMLLRLLGEHSIEPTIIMGDFNEWMPRGRSLRHMQRELGASSPLRTFPSGMPMLALDRIWVRPFRSLESIAVHRSPLARVASDHLPVRAIVRAAGTRH
jgi:endonuclease/exonuclease/phosphatase family metal-dependent hydrolase